MSSSERPEGVGGTALRSGAWRVRPGGGVPGAAAKEPWPELGPDTALRVERLAGAVER